MNEATLNGRQMTIVSIEEIGGRLEADAIARGWDGKFYTLVGKRGSTAVCFKSAKTGEFAKAF